MLRSESWTKSTRPRPFRISELWMSLQANFDLELAQDARGPEIADRIRPREAA
jgi:hypothetical protein